MSLLLIINPGSRAGRSTHLHEFWCAELRGKGISFDVVRTVAPGHAREVARTQTGHDTVVAVGGDGTINEVLDGLLLSGGDDVTMGVLYAGTSPDFCRFHGIPTEPAAALDVLPTPSGSSTVATTASSSPGTLAVAVAWAWGLWWLRSPTVCVPGWATPWEQAWPCCAPWRPSARSICR